MRGPHTLRARLFFWFVGAILLAMVTGSLVAWRTRPESIVGTEQAARHVEERLLELWDDPAATGAFVQGVREVTGFDVQLVGIRATCALASAGWPRTGRSSYPKGRSMLPSRCSAASDCWEPWRSRGSVSTLGPGPGGASPRH